MVILLMTIGGYLLMDIGGYFINGYWWILYWCILMYIGAY
jgi:hypothetical protein